MPNILPALSAYVRRLSRREIRIQTLRLKRASAQHRRDIAALKRLLHTAAGRIATLEKRSGAPTTVTRSAEDVNLRFRRDGLRSHRAKLGLSAKDYGALIGVTGLTIYHWESGQSKPRRRQLPAIAAVRQLGKREALERLQRK